MAKDFAMESDENKMRKAAHLMVQNLAGSLAMVTCKEPLRLTLVTNLRNTFLSNGIAEVSNLFYPSLVFSCQLFVIHLFVYFM